MHHASRLEARARAPMAASMANTRRAAPALPPRGVATHLRRRRSAAVVARVATTTPTTTTTDTPPPPAASAAAAEAAAAFDALLRDAAPEAAAPSAGTTAQDWSSPQRPGWFKAWWPIAAVENLDAGRPNALELMGERLVAWRRADGQWAVQADRCPHRLAPLSDGFVAKDKETIVCGYHGYGFCGKTGGCTRVPAAQGGVGSPAEARAIAGRRAALRTLPAREVAGVLFAWPDPYASDAFADADAAPPPPVPKELEGERFAPLKGRWFERELPHGLDFFHENVLDPQHAPVAHSGVAGFDANKADRLQVRLVTPPASSAAAGGDAAASISNGAITPRGFTLETEMEEPGRRGSLIHFHAPSLVRYEPAPLRPEAAAAQAAAGAAASAAGNNSSKAEARPGDPAGKNLTHLIFYASPIRPGWSKLIGTSFIVDAATGEPSKAASIFTAALPAWLRHVLGHEFMAGDLFILSRASSAYAAEGRRWRSSYWLPTSADAGVVALRRWMETFGGGSDVPVLPASAAGAGVLQQQQQQQPAVGGTSTNFSLPGLLTSSEAAVAASTREQILSRYEQHTKTCAACRGALEATRAVARRSARLAAFAAAAAVLVAAAAAQHAAAVLAAAASTGASGAAVSGWAERAAAALVGATSGVGGPMAAAALLVAAAAACWLVRSAAEGLERAFVNLPYDRTSKAAFL